MSLESDLQEIDGIGPAKSEEISSVVNDYQQDNSKVEEAYEALENGNKYKAKALLEQLL